MSSSGLLLRLQHAADHVFVAAGASQGAFECAASAIGEIVDVASHLVGHHQRQVGMRGLQLGFGLGLHVLVDGGSQFVGFVDRRGLGFLLGESVALLQRG